MHVVSTRFSDDLLGAIREKIGDTSLSGYIRRLVEEDLGIDSSARISRPHSGRKQKQVKKRESKDSENSQVSSQSETEKTDRDIKEEHDVFGRDDPWGRGGRHIEQYRGWAVPESEIDEIFARLAARDPDLAIAFEGIADGFALPRAGLSAEQATVFDQLVELGWAEIDDGCYISRDPSAAAQSVSRAREDEEDLLPSGSRLIGF